MAFKGIFNMFVIEIVAALVIWAVIKPMPSVPIIKNGRDWNPPPMTVQETIDLFAYYGVKID